MRRWQTAQAAEDSSYYQRELRARQRDATRQALRTQV